MQTPTITLDYVRNHVVVGLQLWVYDMLENTQFNINH